MKLNSLREACTNNKKREAFCCNQLWHQPLCTISAFDNISVQCFLDKLNNYRYKLIAIVCIVQSKDHPSTDSTTCAKRITINKPQSNSRALHLYRNARCNTTTKLCTYCQATINICRKIE